MKYLIKPILSAKKITVLGWTMFLICSFLIFVDVPKFKKKKRKKIQRINAT